MAFLRIEIGRWSVAGDGADAGLMEPVVGVTHPLELGQSIGPGC